ncbi:glycosyltransferase, partial [Patescibacteria group bacterium]|nr:glycosyltransferase [Patescibacteria group bacterium]
HPKNKRYKFEDRVISIIVSHPSWGSRKISAILGKHKQRISNHAVYSLLEDLNLETKEKREEFSSLYQTFARIEKIYQPKPLRLTPEARKRVVEEVVIGEEPVSQVCQKYHISRKTFYKWLARYQEAREKEAVLLQAMEDNYIKGFGHPRAISEETQERILTVVHQHPKYSTHKVAQILAEVGNHGVQNVFQKLNLNTYEKRLAYAQAYQPVTIPVPGVLDRLKPILGRIPAISAIPPPTREKIAPLARPFIFSFLSSIAFSTIFIYWLRMLSQAPTPGAKIGLFFATIALGVGSLFFAYSMKYYLTLAIVLSFSRQPLEEGGGFAVSLNGRLNNNQRNDPSTRASTELSRMSSGWLARIFGLGNGNGEGRREVVPAGGLQPSLEHIKLKRYPFVSIHLPFYNEKKVAERILKACTAMDYPNFEIVVCDDSTDETIEIVNKFAKRYNKNHQNGPKIKVLHRLTREGFKGGALAYALKAMDPKTEFIVVFDADFIPYLDTLELFVKYFKVNNNNSEDYTKSNVACVAGYQWHVLNKSENWITRGVRTEYAGSYVIERPGQEILGAMKLIHGSVYAIRADILKKFGWGTSITEDFELTLKLYEQGYKVVYTPYVQAPAECASTLKRLIRQRMRWAEGHSYCVKRMFLRLLSSPKMSLTEKLELLYLSPYYLQAFFFLIGTFSWLLAETVFRARLPFWTSLWGWSLVLTNFFSLPLVNAVGLFLEEAEEKDYLGIFSFVALSYLLVPFQAYASVKGFLEKEEGPWFRTPKTGLITDIFTRGRFYRWISGILPGRRPVPAVAAVSASISSLISANPYVALATANNQFNNFQLRRRERWKWTSKGVLAILMVGVLLLNYLAFFAPGRPVLAQTQPKIEQQINIIDQEYSTASNSYEPTDNSLGIVRWTAGSYTGATVYFEAVFRGLVYEKQRTAVTLTDGTDYTVRIRYLCSYKAPDYYTYSYAYLYVVGGSYV